jgi:hypothetical protein
VHGRSEGEGVINLLGRVDSVARIEELEAHPAWYATQVASVLPSIIRSFDDIEARDALLAQALRHIDDTTSEVMGVLLDRALATDTAIPRRYRKRLTATIVQYVGRFHSLAYRVREVVAGAPDPDGVTQLVVEAARSTLLLRERLRAGILALIRDVATIGASEADRCVCDEALEDPERDEWIAIGRELEKLVADPERVLAGSLQWRIANRS